MRDHVVTSAASAESGSGQVIVLLRRAGAVVGLLFGLGLLAMITAGQASADDQSTNQDNRPAERLTGLLDDVTAPLTASLGEAVAPAPAAETAGPLLRSVADADSPVVGTAGPSVRSVADTASPTVETAEPMVRSATDTAGPVVGTAVPVVRLVADAASPVVETAVPVVRLVADAAGPVVGIASSVVSPVVDAVEPLVSPLVKALGPVLEPVAPVLEPVVDLVAPVTEPLVCPVLRAADPVLSPVTEVVGVEDAVSGLVGQPTVEVPGHQGQVPGWAAGSTDWSAVAGLSPSEWSEQSDVTRSKVTVSRSDGSAPGDRPGSPFGSNAVTGGSASGGSGGQHGADGAAPASGSSSDVDGPGDRAPPGGDVALSWLAFEDRDHPS